MVYHPGKDNLNESTSFPTGKCNQEIYPNSPNHDSREHFFYEQERETEIVKERTLLNDLPHYPK